jgi:hypothetical protein
MAAEQWMRSPRTIYTREGVGRGGKTRVRTGSLAAVGSDGRLLARVSSSHGRSGRRRGQEAERDSKDSCGRGGAGYRARCAPLYSLSLLLLLGPAQLPPSLSCPCFSPHHPAGEPTEGRTRRAGTSTARSSSLEPAAGHAPSSPGGYLSTLAFNIMVVDCLSYTGI